MLGLGKTTSGEEETSRRFYTKQHQFYCGIDLHARPMYLCILNQEGEMLVHRTMPAGPAPFLNAVAPDRSDLVVCVACLCARAGMPLVLGHARSMKALHGGTAQNDTIDAQKIAVLRRGGMLPQAYGYPAALRATRDLLRRRMPLMRKRAELLAHSQPTTSQYHRPELGQKIASNANRGGVAERVPEPAVQQSIEVDLALSGHDDERLRDVARASGSTATHHNANTLDLLRTVPGLGELLSLVLRYEIPDIQRCPRVPEFVSYCRLVKCAKESAGKRYGTSGTKIGNASLQWTCSEAAVLFLRSHAAGQQSLARLEKTHGQGHALTVFAQQLARAVYDMLKRRTAFAMQTLLHG
jgi:transposase